MTAPLRRSGGRWRARYRGAGWRGPYHNKPIFGADRGHIHHRLLDRGFSPRKVALILYGCCALGAVASLAMMSQSYSGIVIVIFCAATWIGIQHLGYIEFGIVGRMFIEGAFRRQLRAQLAIQGFENSLAGATTPQDCWVVIQDACQEFGFHSARMHLAGETFEHHDAFTPSTVWQLYIPVCEGNYVELTRAFDIAGHTTAIAPLADTLRRSLSSKLPELIPATEPPTRTPTLHHISRKAR